MALTLRICNMEHNFRWTSQWRDITVSYCYRWFAWQQEQYHFFHLFLSFCHPNLSQVLAAWSAFRALFTWSRRTTCTCAKDPGLFILDTHKSMRSEKIPWNMAKTGPTTWNTTNMVTAPVLVQVRKLGSSWIRSIKRRIWECWVSKISSNCRTLLLQRKASEKDKGPEQGIW